MTTAVKAYADRVQSEQEAFYREADTAFDAYMAGEAAAPAPAPAREPVSTRPQPSEPSENALDMLASLWATSAQNPDVKRRQERSEKKTEFMIEHQPGYAAELARLIDWCGSYEIPLRED